MADLSNPQEKKPSILEGMFRHPLGVMVVGFMLTGVGGTMLTNHLADIRQREAEATRIRDSRRTAVQGLSRLMSERVTRMAMLANAIDRHSSPQVVVELQRLHAETEAKWAMHRSEYFLLAREILGETDYDTFRSEIETRMVRKRILPLRECLERACGVAATGGDGAAVLKEGHAMQLLEECSVGGEVFLTGLYDLASISQLELNASEASKMRESVLKKFEKACP